MIKSFPLARSQYKIFKHEGVEVIYNIEFPYYTRSLPLLKELLSFRLINNKSQLNELKSNYGEKKVQNAMNWLVKKNFFKGSNEKDYNEITTSDREYDQNIHTIVLSISHDCNLACSYCYADRGRYGGQKGFCSFHTAKATVDFLFENSGEHEKLKFFFFGGEPLLNFSLVQKVVPYIRKKEREYGKHVRIGFTTNATILTKKIIDFCNDNDIYIHVSIDGPKHIHDINRPFPNKIGSFDLIKKNLQYLFETRPKGVSSRATFTHGNIHLIKSIQSILEMGFASVYIGPASGLHESSIRQEDLGTVMNQYNSLMQMYIEKKKNNERFPVNPLDLKVKQCNRRRLKARLYGCGAGRGYVAVTKDGDIFPCKKCIESGYFRLGDIYDGISEEMHKYFLTNIVTKPTKECSSCWVRFLCGGSCIMRPLEYGVMDIDKSYNFLCEITKYIYKLAMIINIKLEEMHMATLWPRFKLERDLTRIPEEEFSKNWKYNLIHIY
ncbi:MAG: SPASM domain-containing protein [Candidatus Helarchaeota archaeon]|nr:SPASM domain-containing protein [Candidatus Helarchaeota archaeon]